MTTPSDKQTDNQPVVQLTEQGANGHIHRFGIISIPPEFGHSYWRCVSCLLAKLPPDHDPATCEACAHISRARVDSGVVDARCTKCGHFSTVDIHNEGECQERGQSGFICGCKCVFPAPACVKCGHNEGVERTLKRCKARIDGGEALCQCHCVFPAATAPIAAPQDEAQTSKEED